MNPIRRKHAALKIRPFDFDVKSVDESGKFSGYASVFGVVDSYNEVVAPGAFTDSLAELRNRGRTLPTLWQHRGAEPIGNWLSESLIEDSRGLKGEGELWLEEAPYARIAHRGMRSRAITGLSIGYYERAATRDEKTGIRTLTKLELVEISIVTTPANDEARVDQVKSRLAHGDLPTLREFEMILREMGFSKNSAAVVATRGLKHLLDRGEPGPEGDSGSLLKLLESFKL